MIYLLDIHRSPILLWMLRPGKEFNQLLTPQDLHFRPSSSIKNERLHGHFVARFNSDDQHIN